MNTTTTNDRHTAAYDITEIIAGLPKALDETEFNDLLACLKADGLDAFLKSVYVKSDKTYMLRNKNTAGSRNDDDQLWQKLLQKYYDLNREKWRNCVAVYLVAEYIYEHRREVGRKGDQIDDYVKALYLVSLVSYLNQKRLPVIRLRQDNEMEEIIDVVNNIFDSAYFRKLNQPERTDVECFLEAEREFCEDKDIDFLLYQKQLSDYSTAEQLHMNQEIQVLAHCNFELRKSMGIPDDATRDWIEAEKEYPAWRSQKRIATICWNLSTNKSRHQDYYWLQAGQVIAELEQRCIPYRSESPYTPAIYNVITAFVSKKEPAK